MRGVVVCRTERAEDRSQRLRSFIMAPRNMPNRIAATIAALFGSNPLVRRLAWHARRVGGALNRRFYRVDVPTDLCGLAIDEASARLRRDYRATLLAVSRAGQTYVNPPTDFILQPGDDALVVAKSLGTLAPLRIVRAVSRPSG